jgi:hypothetical protein
MNVVVDNSAGGDPQLAEEVARGLRDRGLDVEVRKPDRAKMFDTSVNLVATGIAIRVATRPDRAQLDSIGQVVRAALQHRPSVRRRSRSVPVHLGETARVVEWIDLYD